MPKLARLRLVSIGHPNARFDDLVLDFTDETGLATDTTLWLRNGGGKSSILNLFFALLRPDRREFLGSKAEAKQRHLEEYVLARDRAVVAAEWELERGRDGNASPRRYLTGVFYEWRGPAGADAGQLRRLFFAGFVSFDDLPLYLESDGGRSRRTFSLFRAAWQELRGRRPELQLFDKEEVKEWTKQLEEIGIDPELFSYQIRMNRREGGADEVFRFADHDQFTDFLLELALDPAQGDAVAKNIGTYRHEIRQRKEAFLPERELVEGLIERMSPLVDIAASRADVQDRVAGLRQRMSSTVRFAEAKASALADEARKLEGQRREHEAELARIETESAAAKRNAAALRHAAARLRQAAVAEEYKKAQLALELAQAEVKLWLAAIPLAKVRRHRRQADEFRRQLEQRRTEHAPLREELVQTAEQYAAAVLHAARGRRTRALEATLRSKAARTEAVERRAESAKRREKTAELRGAAELIASELRTGEVERTRLVDRGTLAPFENGAAALVRLAVQESATRSEIQQAEREIEKLVQRRADLSAERERTAREASSTAAKRDAARVALDAARVEKGQLESEACLKRILEVESLDLELLDAGVLSRLEDATRRAVERIVEIKAQHASDARAIVHLEEHGLLPPTRDVEQILAVLRPYIPGAWSGWRYFAENAGPSSDAKRDCVRRAPEIALGVVVRDSDYEKASQILSTADLVLETPVVIAPQGTVEEKESGGQLVLGPSSNAYFDRKSAERELHERRTKIVVGEAELERLEHERAELTEVTARLREFFRRYPKGWFQERAASVEELDRRTAILEKDAARLGRALEELDERSRAQQRALLELNRRIQTLDASLRSVTDYVQRFEEKLASKTEEREGLLAQADLEDLRRRDADDSALRADREAEASEAESRTLGEEARALEESLRAIEYLPRGTPEAREGRIEDLEALYRLRKRAYEQAIGEETLIHLEENERSHQRAEQKKLRAELDKHGLEERAVGDALDMLSETSTVEERFAEVSGAKDSAMGVVGNRANARRAADERVDEAAVALRSLGGEPLENYGGGPAQAEEEARAFDETATASGIAAADLAGRIQDLANGHKRALERRSTLERAQERVSLLFGAYRDLLEVAEPIEGTVTEIVEQEIDELTRGFETTATSLRDQSAKLDMRRGLAVKAVRSFAQELRFDALKSVVAKKLASAEETVLETHARAYKDELTLRRDTLSALIADVDRYRESIVNQAAIAAEEGIALLKQASNLSRLPDHVPGHGGKQFLRITLSAPDDPGERRGRIGALVDELCESGQLPSGLALVQQAVRRVARPIRVRVLHPDPDIGREMVEIPEMARFSGGEQLTGAILLYCTLAQLRARTRGAVRRASSALILDNPIGRASRARFLELQREVARAMSIQLIYTTGVNDFDALRALPNVIRLKNERIDRNTGHQVVESEGRIDAIRLGRVEKNLLPAPSPVET